MERSIYQSAQQPLALYQRLCDRLLRKHMRLMELIIRIKRAELLGQAWSVLIT